MVADNSTQLKVHPSVGKVCLFWLQNGTW